MSESASLTSVTEEGVFVLECVGRTAHFEECTQQISNGSELLTAEFLVLEASRLIPGRMPGPVTVTISD